MLYPDLESDYYPEISKFNILLTERHKIPYYIIHVTNHCKTDTSSETFIEYTIVTERETQFIVSRRYSDFDWLMKYLYNKNPLYILPPMPPKRLFAMTDKYSRQFINIRQQALSRMLHRLSYFQSCLEDPNVRAFLQYNQKEFALYRKQHKNPSLLHFLQESVNKAYMNAMLSFKGEKPCIIKDESTRSCFEIIHKRLTEKSTLALMSKSLDYMSLEWEIFSQCLLWTAQHIADIVLMTENMEVTVFLDGAAQFFFNWSTESKSYFNYLFDSLNPIFNDYIAYDNYIIDIILNRNKSKVSLESTKKSILAVQSHMNQEAYNSLPRGNRYDQLMAQSIILEDQLNDFDRIFYPSYSDWQQQRSCDIANCLNVIVQTNLRYHRSCLDLCKTLLNKIIEN